MQPRKVYIPTKRKQVKAVRVQVRAKTPPRNSFWTLVDYYYTVTYLDRKSRVASMRKIHLEKAWWRHHNARPMRGIGATMCIRPLNVRPYVFPWEPENKYSDHPWYGRRFARINAALARLNAKQAD